jgi:hypothetical protein
MEKYKEFTKETRNMKLGGRKGYTLNDDFFEIIDTPEKAYFLGFLYADGCVIRNSNGLLFQLKENDLYIIEKFRSLLEFTGPIRLVVRKNNHYKLVVYSSKLIKDLFKWGVISNKSNILDELPNLNEDMMSHFIRGYFDGDGYIGACKRGRNQKNSLRFNVVGTENFLLNLQEILIKELGLTKTKLQVYKWTNARGLEYGGNSNAKKIYDYLYKNNPLCLTRKKRRFEEVLGAD